MTTHHMTGKSGTSYTFHVLERWTPLPPKRGIYVMLERIRPGAGLGVPTQNTLANALLASPTHRAVYIGKSENLDERVGLGLHAHHKLYDAMAVGATHLGVIIGDYSSAQIAAFERDLIDGNLHLLNGLPKLSGLLAS